MSAVRWTAKLPTLIIGLMLILAGLVTTWKRGSILGIVLIMLGGGFVAYSMTIKDWCEIRGQSAFAGAFGGGFHECLKLKGYFAF